MTNDIERLRCVVCTIAVPIHYAYGDDDPFVVDTAKTILAGYAVCNRHIIQFSQYIAVNGVPADAQGYTRWVMGICAQNGERKWLTT